MDMICHGLVKFGGGAAMGRENGEGGGWWRYGSCVLSERESGCLETSKR